jgi:heme-degrading monooxygenase HmoA
MSGVMFVNMGFVTPLPGKEEAMAETVRSFAKALEEMPGLLAVFVLAEEGGRSLVGVSMWSNKKAFEVGMEKVRPPPPPEPFEQLRAAPPTTRQFETVR